jgi:hypothetical protein
LLAPTPRQYLHFFFFPHWESKETEEDTPLLALLAAAKLAAGAQLACCTSTEGQILTPEQLLLLAAVKLAPVEGILFRARTSSSLASISGRS